METRDVCGNSLIECHKQGKPDAVSKTGHSTLQPCRSAKLNGNPESRLRATKPIQRSVSGSTTSRLPSDRSIRKVIRPETTNPKAPVYSRSLSAPLDGSSDIKSLICAITHGLEKDGSIHLTPGKESKLRLFLWNKDIRSQTLNLDKLKCRFSVKCEVEEKGHSSIKMKQIRSDTLEVVLMMAEEGICQLVIEYLDFPVEGSPYKVVCSSPLPREEVLRESLFSNGFSNPAKAGKSASSRSTPDPLKGSSTVRFPVLDEEDFLIRNIGTFGREPGQFLNPQGICLTDDGDIAVTDSSIGCIQVFDSDGSFKSRIGERGRKPGQIFRPTGIAFVPKRLSKFGTDAFVVADYENKTVVIFGVNGKMLSTFGSGKLTGPKGVAVATNGDILVVDNRSNSVFVFRCGKLFKKIWAPSATAARLAGPHYIAVQPETGDIVISDFHHHSIKIFNPDYTYRQSFGGFSPDGGMGSFSGPTGVAADLRGIVVSDWGTGYIQVFDYSGSFLAYVTNLNNPLYGPQGLAVAPDGTIYAADCGNHTVRVYRHPLT